MCPADFIFLCNFNLIVCLLIILSAHYDKNIKKSDKGSGTEIKKNHNILIFYFTVSDNPVNLIYSTLNFKMIPLDIMSGGFDIVSSLTWGYFSESFEVDLQKSPSLLARQVYIKMSKFTIFANDSEYWDAQRKVKIK